YSALGASAYPSIRAALAAAPPDRRIVLEVQDNGPLFEMPLRIKDRAVTLRAAKGFRPLVVWDVQGTLDERKRFLRGKPTETGPLVFLDVKGGRLTLEGIDLALRWPESATESAFVFDLAESSLDARDCTFSIAGKHPLAGKNTPGEAPAGWTLVRFRASK